jgi:uncharacterized membrane-anchored protein YhcB (DUF1043 family)
MKTFALVALAVVLLGGQIALAGQETLWTGTRPNDYFDLLLKESTERWVAIVGLIVIGVLAVVVYARTSHVRSEIEKKVEDEFNEIKQRYDLDLDPKSQVLTENQRLQNLKDVFQTIAQGRRRYGHRSESRKARKDPRKAQKKPAVLPCFPCDPVLSVIQRSWEGVGTRARSQDAVAVTRR